MLVFDACVSTRMVRVFPLKFLIGLRNMQRANKLCQAKSATTFTPMACLLSAHAEPDIINVSFEASAFMVAENNESKSVGLMG